MEVAAGAGGKAIGLASPARLSFAAAVGAKKPVPYEIKSFAGASTTNLAGTGKSAQLSTKRGSPSIDFPQEAVNIAALPYRFTLVGKFSQGRPQMEEIRKFFQHLDFQFVLIVGLLDRRHILIQFHEEVDFQWLWARPVWHVQRFPMRIFKWTQDFRVDKESPIAPIWFSLPNLPIQFFHKDLLFQLASCLGKPICVDAATAARIRPSVARICVEVNLSSPSPTQIWLSVDSTQGFWQRIHAEDRPHYCGFCFRQGHEELNCRIKHPDNHKHSNSRQWSRRSTGLVGSGDAAEVELEAAAVEGNAGGSGVVAAAEKFAAAKASTKFEAAAGTTVSDGDVDQEGKGDIEGAAVEEGESLNDDAGKDAAGDQDLVAGDEADERNTIDDVTASDGSAAGGGDGVKTAGVVENVKTTTDAAAAGGGKGGAAGGGEGDGEGVGVATILSFSADSGGPGNACSTDNGGQQMLTNFNIPSTMQQDVAADCGGPGVAPSTDKGGQVLLSKLNFPPLVEPMRTECVSEGEGVGEGVDELRSKGGLRDTSSTDKVGQLLMTKFPPMVELMRMVQHGVSEGDGSQQMMTQTMVEPHLPLSELKITSPLTEFNPQFGDNHFFLPDSPPPPEYRLNLSPRQLLPCPNDDIYYPGVQTRRMRRIRDRVRDV